MVDVAILLVTTSGLTVVIPYEHGDTSEISSTAVELQVVLTEGIGIGCGLDDATILTEVAGDALLDVCLTQKDRSSERQR